MVGAPNAAAAAAPACCCVCFEVEDYNGSVLVQCAQCGIRVHVKCYGRSVGGNLTKWRCEPCEFQATAKDQDGAKADLVVPPQCAVCPVAGGALRRTTQRDVWCHMLCMNWIPELQQSLTGELDQPLDVSRLDPSRDPLRCLVCGLRGGCIQCVSGRCTRAFHVSCAFRAPSELIFTGYNDANQQVYHCKTHLSDVASRQYEMNDTAWRSFDRVRAYINSHPPTPGRCRYCAAKFTPSNKDVHEDQCVLAWLTKEDARMHKLLLTRAGITPSAISRSKKSKASGDSRQRNRNGRANGGDRRSTASSKAKREHGSAPMRSCPECGELVRETLMMGHLRTSCARSKHAKQGKWKRKHLEADGVVDLTASPVNGSGGSDTDLTDVLFDAWPGQNAGAPMNSAHLWKVVDRSFFSSKLVVKKRLDQMCKTMCGAKLDDIANYRRRPLESDLHCRDTVLLGRADKTNALSTQTTVHRCDFMMRASRSHCVSDAQTEPFLEIHSRGASESDNPTSEAANGGGMADKYSELQPSLELKGDVRVAFTSVDDKDRTASCTFSMRMSGESAVDLTNEQSGDVWSAFQHDAVSTLAGQLQDVKLPLAPDTNLLIALRDVAKLDPAAYHDKFEPIEPVLRVEEEITPVVNLLMGYLNEQMEQNRCHLRSLARKLQLKERQEAQFQATAQATELYYSEFAAWKQLCKSLLVGYRGSKSVSSVLEDLGNEAAEMKSEHSQDEDEEEPIDDGTCVVCFDGQSPESNPIVFCDRCELAVHQRCYGIVKVPSSEFICDRCKAERDGLDPATDVFCQLCSLGDGAFKRTVDGKWVHVVCALWCPKVWIGNLLELSEISLVGTNNRGMRFQDGLAEVKAQLVSSPAVPNGANGKKACDELPASESLGLGDLCMHCRVACGRTIQCCHPDCTTSFHPLCGWFEGLPMTIGLAETGFVYGGGGAGLKFEMFCKDHLPTDYPESERQTQSQRRRKFRIDAYFVIKNKNSFFRHSRLTTSSDSSSLLSGSIVQAIIAADKTTADPSSTSDWTDKALCSACFEFIVPVTEPLKDINLLSRRQFMMRCQYCNIYIHPECCISDIKASASIFRSNWICERCTQLGGKGKAAGCVVCSHTSDYLMPCANPSTSNSNVKAGNGAAQLPSSQQQSPRNSKVLAQSSILPAGQPGQQRTVGVAGEAPVVFDKWMHVYCCKWKKAKVVKRHHIQHAQPPPLGNSSSLMVSVSRCELCFEKTGELASCAQCNKRFHPICAAKKKLYCARSNRNDWKFYCEAHAPSDAVYDEKRQSWMTRDILNQLLELRRSLERGRMLLEMSRQRDRQQKRLLNVCQIPFMEASIEIVLKKRPTPTMREVFHSLTGDTLSDTPRRHRPVASPAKRRRTGVRNRATDNNEETSSDRELTPHRSSARLAGEKSPSVSKRALEEAGEDSRPTRSKRRRLEVELDEAVAVESSRPTRNSSRRQSPRNQARADAEDAAELRSQQQFFDELSFENVPAEFDGAVRTAYPELVSSLS